jgi:putative proteasome-type protease
MTYCCGILVREGLVMFADTRTNAGVDNIATFRKLHIFQDPKKRIMAIASAGNLSISQSVVSILTEGYENPQTGERETLMNAPTMFQAAQRVGYVVRLIHEMEGKALEASEVGFDVSLLFGGQIMGDRMRLFMIYSAGNFIECTTDTPYLQIGEHKYGKPVLDRAITYEMDLYDALKVGLVSIDSTMRSNLSVGLPIDLLVARRDSCVAELMYRIEPDGQNPHKDPPDRQSRRRRANLDPKLTQLDGFAAGYRTPPPVGYLCKRFANFRPLSCLDSNGLGCRRAAYGALEHRRGSQAVALEKSAPEPAFAYRHDRRHRHRLRRRCGADISPARQ